MTSVTRSYLPRTKAFLKHSWPTDMLPEVSACEREIEAAESRREAEILRFWIARIAAAQDADRDWQGLGSWTREALHLAIVEADTAVKGN